MGRFSIRVLNCMNQEDTAIAKRKKGGGGIGLGEIEFFKTEEKTD